MTGDIKFGMIYKAITKNKKGEPWDYVIPFEIDDARIQDMYIEIEYLHTGNRGIIEIPTFHQRYELL